MIGIPLADWTRYRRWSDVILRLSYTRSGGDEAEHAMRDFTAVTAEMDACLADMIEQRRIARQDDLLTRLIEAEVWPTAIPAGDPRILSTPHCRRPGDHDQLDRQRRSVPAGES
jgi:cytochrome P450